MSSSQSDRNVLFGVLALQMEFITQAGLIAALQAWTLQKSRPLGELLVELGHMSAEDRAAMEPMVDRHVARHGGSAEQSLAALSSVSEVAAELRELHDVDVQHSLQHVAAAESRQAGVISGAIPANDRDLPAGSPPGDGGELPPQLQPTLMETMQQAAQPAMRFLLLRPHAEGGLGKVWIARDRELNREVAFKEIKSKRAQDKNSRARFVLEAEITGGLEHPGIVPVYGLGHFEDGRPFYAMRFIRGRSLKEAIDQFHKTNAERLSSSLAFEQDRQFRNLVQRLIDVCNAIAYAHSRGVLHRDLKPGNIMLGKYGETLVVDWGLAKAKGQSFDPAASATMEALDHEPLLSTTGSHDVAATQMGSAIGTPQFMSPEQAAGRLDLLGPASDVYSLGATLYELLTGQAPIGALPGGDSEKLTIPEVLRRVENGEFPAPRAVLAAVPAALEAVCLKAMSRDPQARYATTQALAEDLERWLAGDPVSAWPEPLLVRARRWVKRHPTLVVSTAATLLISLVSLAAIASVVGQSNRSLATKNSELEQANQREREATSLAQQNAQIAREQSQLALKSLQSVIFDIQRKLHNVPGAGDLQRALLQTALARLQEVSDQFAARGAIDRNTYAALIDLGDVFLRIGSGSSGDASEGAVAAAQKLFLRALEISQKLAAADPSDAQAQRDLSISYNKLGDVQLQSGQVTEALGSYQKSFDIKQKLSAADPSDAQAQRDLSISYNKLGDVQLQSGQVTEALGSYQKSFDIKQKLAAADPSDAQAQRDLSVSYEKLGDVQLQSGQVTEALGSYQKGLAIRQKLAAADPSDAQAQRGLSISYDKLGDVQLQSGQVTEALGSYQKGLAIRQKLAAADPSDAQAQRDLSISYNKLGDVQLQSGQVTEALGSYQKMYEINQKLAAADPSDAQAQRDLSVSYNKLGDVQLQSGQVTEALGSYQKGLAIRQKLAAADPSDAQAQRDLSVSYNKLGDVQLQAGQVTEALGSYQQAFDIKQKLAAADPSDAQAQFGLYISLKNVARAEQAQQRYELAIESYENGLRILQRLKELKRLAPANEQYIMWVEQQIAYCRNAPIALGNWATLLEQPADVLPVLLEMRGVQFVQEGRAGDAVQAVAKLRELGTATAGQLYNAACVYSLCATGIKPVKDELTVEQTVQRKKHIADALETLREAIKAGWKDFDHIQKDPDLAVLRDLPEFKALLPK